MQQIIEALRPQLDWLRRSGIQVADGPERGAVQAWIDEDSGAGSFLYSEITGYFMTLAVQISRLDPEGDWIERAERAAAWIADRAMLEDGALLTRKYTGSAEGQDDVFSFERGLSVFFDCAMVGFGLLNTHEASGDARWLETARALGDFCLGAFESPDRDRRFAIFDTRRQQPLPPADRWSHHFGSFELKGAMFFDSLARLTGEQRYADFVARVLEAALADQQHNGRFGTDLELRVTHLHPHNYTTEGLLYLAGRHGREDLLERAKRAVDFSFGHCLDAETGRVVQAWSEQQESVIPELRSDVLAQSLRAYQLAKLLDPHARWSWEGRLEALEQRLDGFTLPSGGTSYGQDEFGVKSSHANAWCHFFNSEMRLLQLVRLTGAEWEPREMLIT